MRQETAQRAAKWWADQLRQPAKLDNGDKSNTGMATFMMATILQSKEREKMTSRQVDNFEKALTDLIVLENIESNRDMLFISVDYDPDYLLTRAAEMSGVNLGMASLPWKTTMCIKDDQVSVRCGYGAEAETLND